MRFLVNLVGSLAMHLFAAASMRSCARLGAARQTWRQGLALLIGVFFLSAASAQVVRLGGTGAALGSMALLAKAYQQREPGFQFEIVPNLGSAGGVRALNAGAIQLAVIGRALKPQETATGLQLLPYGQTAFVLISNKAGIEGMSLAQLAEIYAGKSPRWSDGQIVRLVLRPAADGDTALLAAFSPSMKTGLEAAQAREGMVVAMTDQDSVDAVERLPGALGTTSLSLLLSERRRARALAIDGVAPTIENMASGRYPYLKTMYLASKPDAPASVGKFVAFVRSDAGRRILVETGHIGVPAGAPSVLAAKR